MSAPPTSSPKITTHNLQDTIALLSRTPATLNALLRDLPQSWTLRNEGENTMSPFDVVGHLIEAERSNWITRTKHIMQFGDSQAFAAFDRSAYEKEVKGKSLSQLLDRFAELRAENIKELQAMDLRPGDLARPGLHPALGPVTLGNLLATWVSHDLTHLHQISRVLAHHYRDTVGPFSRYLGVLKCQGHSDAA